MVIYTIGRTRAFVYIQKLTGLLLGPEWSCRTPTMREKLFILKLREWAENDFISRLLCVCVCVWKCRRIV